MRERTSELERSNDELQKFASFLSHELRQPLGTQMIWIELLESQAADALDETARRNLEKHPRDGAQDVRPDLGADRAHPAARVARGEPIRVDLAAVVRDAIGVVSPQLEAVGAKMPVGALPHVRGDAGQLTQLFRNLLDNALKFRRDGVQCEIAISAQVASDPAFAGGCEIAVEDNGRGFAPEDAERIFAAARAARRGGTRGPGPRPRDLPDDRRAARRHACAPRAVPARARRSGSLCRNTGSTGKNFRSAARGLAVARRVRAASRTHADASRRRIREAHHHSRRAAGTSVALVPGSRSIFPRGGM